MSLPSRRKPPDRKREFFAPPSMVMATMISVVFFLYLIFPRQSLTELLEGAHTADPLARDYLETLLQVQPGDHATRLLLARQELSLGEPASARRTALPLLRTSPEAFRWQGLWLSHEAASRQAYAHPEGSALREKELETVRTLQDAMVDGPWQRSELERLARESRAAGNQHAAVRYLMRLVSTDQTPAAAVSAAEMALAVGEYRRAAEFYFAAKSRATDLATRRKWFMAGVNALRAGNLPAETVAAAEDHLEGLETDRETLVFITRTAFAAGRGQVAERYLKRLLQAEAS